MQNTKQSNQNDSNFELYSIKKLISSCFKSSYLLK